MVLIYSLEAGISAIGADAVCWIDPAFLGLTLSVLRVLLITPPSNADRLERALVPRAASADKSAI